MHAMWKPQKFKAIYLWATAYVMTLTLPSAAAVYWAFGDSLLNHSNAFALLPRSPWRNMAVILMLIHQFITFGFACTPLYFVWEKAIGMHDCKSMCKRAAARLPVVVPIWFLAIIFPFFGPINSTVGSLLVSFTVYIIPALAHMFVFRSPAARENAVEPPPKFLGRWVGTYTINVFVVVWVFIVGFGFGGWARGHKDHVFACLCHMLYFIETSTQYILAFFILKRMEKTRNKPKELLPYGMLLTRLFKHVVSFFPELAIDHYISHDRVMHPLAPHYERKTRSDHGKKRPRESNASSSSTTLNHPSSSRPLDDTIDKNDDESFRSNSSFPSQNVSSSSNVVPKPPSAAKNFRCRKQGRHKESPSKQGFCQKLLSPYLLTSKEYISWMRVDAMIKGWLTAAMEKNIRNIGKRNGPPGPNKERSRAKVVKKEISTAPNATKWSRTWGLLQVDRIGNGKSSKPTANMAHKENVEGEWIIDSGCTECITHLSNVLVNKKETSLEEPIAIPTRESIPVKGKRDHTLIGGEIVKWRRNLISAGRCEGKLYRMKIVQGRRAMVPPSRHGLKDLDMHQKGNLLTKTQALEQETRDLEVKHKQMKMLNYLRRNHPAGVTRNQD
uniref:Auxin transporter-like protein 2 n=1 Tax=Tanacetum cinerariifolium TaxID=118510 RepID=A0A6L2LAU3_TANCI|nr:auxin transporter-like protein 2 [Tanacetum cinerariifolium]